MTATKCIVCGGETEGGRYCDGHDDLARYDPFAPVAVDLVLLRRIGRRLSLVAGDLAALERVVSQQRMAGR
jgi:hypothetical protein